VDAGAFDPEDLCARLHDGKWTNPKQERWLMATAVTQNTQNTDHHPDPGWTKPETVKEALERGLEFARSEERWACGDWFAPLFPGDLKTDHLGRHDPSKLTCWNVKACAAGILVLTCLDGQAIRRYFRDQVNPSELLRHDEVGAEAARLLYAGLHDQEPDEYTTTSLAIDGIVAFNDKPGTAEDDSERLAAHHSRIVEGFERAVALADRPSQEVRDAIALLEGRGYTVAKA
jgi:hypothetical protein